MKKLFSLLLASALLVSSLAGCGGQSGSSSESDSSAAGTDSSATTSEVSTNSEDWPVVSTPVVPTQPVTDEKMVEDALNEYLVSIDAGVQCDVVPIEFGNLSTTMTLMLTSNDDPIDVFSYNFFSNLTSVVANEQVVALDDYLTQYPDLVDVIGEAYLPGGQVDGVQYALPTVGSYGTMWTYVLRRDIAETIGVDDRDGEMINMQEMTDIMLQAKEAYPELIFMPIATDANQTLYDTLGDYSLTGVLMNCGVDNTDVVNFYETEEYATYLQYAKQWEEAGLLLDDPLNQNLDKSYLKTGVAGGALSNGFNVENVRMDMASTYNFDAVVFALNDPTATVGSTAGAGYCISTVSNNPDAAMKLLYLMYTDEQVMRYLAQGIENVHYVVDENGCSWYPEGESQTSLGWGTGAQWYFPNQTLCIPFQTDDPNYYEEMMETNETCEKSLAIGFTFNNEPVYNQYTAVTNVVDEYANALNYAQVDVDEMLPQFLEELKAAGIDDVIAEKQAQLDAFLASEE